METVLGWGITSWLPSTSYICMIGMTYTLLFPTLQIFAGFVESPLSSVYGGKVCIHLQIAVS